jgi:hypothetical protein
VYYLQLLLMHSWLGHAVALSSSMVGLSSCMWLLHSQANTQHRGGSCTSIKIYGCMIRKHDLDAFKFRSWQQCSSKRL